MDSTADKVKYSKAGKANDVVHMKDRPSQLLPNMLL